MHSLEQTIDSPMELDDLALIRRYSNITDLTDLYYNYKCPIIFVVRSLL